MPETNLVSHAIIDNLDDIDGHIIVDLPHHEIHEGNFYTVVRSSLIAAAASFSNFLLPATTHATGKDRHCVIDITSNNSGILYLLENTGSTKAAGGTTLTPVNHKRNSTKASYFKAQVDPTTDGAGTVIYQAYLGTNAPALRIGGSAASREEYVLKSTVDYMLRFDPENNATNVIYVVGWYETTKGM